MHVLDRNGRNPFRDIWMAIFLIIVFSSQVEAQNYYQHKVFPNYLDDPVHEMVKNWSVNVDNTFRRYFGDLKVFEHEKQLIANLMYKVNTGAWQNVQNLVRSTSIKRILLDQNIAADSLILLAKNIWNLQRARNTLSCLQDQLADMKKGRTHLYQDGKRKSEIKKFEITDGDRILEIGAGSYQTAKHLLKKHKNTELFLNDVDTLALTNISYQISYDKKLAKFRKENNNKVFLIAGSESSTGVENMTFHKIIIRQTFHHFSKPLEMLQSIRKSMIPGTTLIIIESINDDNRTLGCGRALKIENLEKYLADAGLKRIAKRHHKAERKMLLYKYRLKEEDHSQLLSNAAQ